MSRRTKIQAEIQWHQTKIKELMAELATCDQNDDCLKVAETIPAEMFFQIFKYFEFDCRILKNCRLACRTWKDAIDNNPKLIKSFTFDIFDARTFLESTLSTKAKSIRFQYALQNSEECLEELFSKIGTSVQEVYICFTKDNCYEDQDTSRRSRELLMFKLMLQYCHQLKTLILSHDNYSSFIPPRTDLCNEKYRTALNTIQSLSVNAKMASDLQSSEVYDFILNLPNLTLMDFYSYPDPGNSTIVCRILSDYLKKYNGNLKEISLTQLYQADDQQVLLRLMLSIGKFYPSTNIIYDPVLSCLADFEETDELPVNENTCHKIRIGVLFISNTGEILDTTRIGFCTNLISLAIEIEDGELSPTNLHFIERLRKLRYLKINTSRSSPYFVHEFLTFAIPSLTTLELQGPQFQLNSLLFHTYFPNLTKLVLGDLSLEIRLDFIFMLTKLDLKCLTIEGAENLTDCHLTYGYDSTLEQTADNIPAIARFKSLTNVYIALCSQLTDISLVNGLKFCDKLKSITLCYLKEQFTTSALDLLQQSRSYSVQTMTGTHVDDGHCYYADRYVAENHRHDEALEHKRFTLP